MLSTIEKSQPQSQSESKLPSTGKLFLNGSSGNSRLQTILPELQSLAESLGLEIAFSDSSEDLQDQIQRAAQEGCPNILVGGGDDTVRPAIYGLQRAGFFDCKGGLMRQRTTFGIVPLGTFNNFARHLGIASDWKQALTDGLLGQPVQCDLGLVELSPDESILFTESVGLGLDVQAWKEFPEEAPQLWKRAWDGLSAFVRALRDFTPKKYRIRTDSGVIRIIKPEMLTVANAQRFCAGLSVAPLAQRDDGKLDLCILPNSWFWRLLGFPILAMGWHVNRPDVDYSQVETVEISRDQGFRLRIDSQLTRPIKKASVRVLPRMLPIRVGIAAETSTAKTAPSGIFSGSIGTWIPSSSDSPL